VDPFYNWTIRVVPYLSVSWKSSLWWTNIGGLSILGGLLSLATYLIGCYLSWMFSCQLFVMWCGNLWSRIQYVFPAHILQVFFATSPPNLIISISFALPIDRGQLAPLLVYFGYLLAIFCYVHSATITDNFNLALKCAGSPEINALSHSTISKKHKQFNLIVQPQPMALWTSLQMAKLAFSQLVTPAADYNNLITENDSLVNNWPQQSSSIFIFTWEWLQLPGFTLQMPNINFPNISMVYKPNLIILGYIGNWNTNNPSNNLLYLVWFTTHGERARQSLFNNNYSPIGPTGTELFWARISLIFQIGDNLNNLFKLLQKLLCLWFLPAKWSVLQPLVTRVVGSSQLLCKK